jgi:hypothetical protein
LFQSLVGVVGGKRLNGLLERLQVGLALDLLLTSVKPRRKPAKNEKKRKC